MALLETDLIGGGNPVDAVELVADDREWAFERSTPDEIAIQVEGTWTDYSVSFSWMEAFEALHIACAFDMRVPRTRRDEALRLLSLVNEQMMFGHFDLWLDDGSVMFRHGVPLNGGAEMTEAQVEALLVNALTSCERYHQAFQFVVWGGQNARTALESTLFDTVGEA